jgi:hypothetical protein
MTKAHLIARRERVSLRHARRLLAEGNERVEDVAGLNDDQVVEALVSDLIKELAIREDLLGKGFGCWRVYFLDDLLKHGKEAMTPARFKLVQAISDAHEAASEPILRLYAAVDALLRLYDPDLDRILREDEEQERRRRPQAKRKHKPAPATVPASDNIKTEATPI